ncbi:MAG: hypothetical protein K6F37_01335 [Lachnospiraceae bacterium]|nr:hypothetical protein [Lachnospiraceae bacterium]
MVDNTKKLFKIEGKTVILEEIAPPFFSFVIEWRNNKENNRYLNQNFLLTNEKEEEWYESVYRKDATQGFLIMIDRATGTPFGTMGWTHMDRQQHRCISGRLLIGDYNYRSSIPFTEAGFIASDYLYTLVDTMYCHVVKESRKVLALNKHSGYVINNGKIQYPEECQINGMDLVELYRTKAMYEKAKQKWSLYFPNLLS